MLSFRRYLSIPGEIILVKTGFAGKIRGDKEENVKSVGAGEVWRSGGDACVAHSGRLMRGDT